MQEPQRKRASQSVDSAGGACYTGVRKGVQAMPTISKFYGLVIRMYYDDKHVPHFHVGYAEYRALIAVEDGSIIAGRLPLRA
jgi:hypothetical protein